MAIGDIPRLPDKDVKRVEELVKRVKSGETDVSTILEKSVSALGRFRIDSTGLEIKDRLKIDSEALQSIFESIILSRDIMPDLHGKHVFLKIRDKGQYKVKFGSSPSLSEASEREVQQTTMPVIEVDLYLIPYLFQGFEGMLYLTGEQLVCLHRMDNIFQWLGDGWEGGLRLLESRLPLFNLTTKKFLSQLGEPLAALCDEVLTQCGV